jgi:hypothetical protein
MREIVSQEDALPDGETVSDDLVAEFERLKAALERTEPRIIVLWP